MLTKNLRRNFIFLVVVIITSVGLTGCFKGEVSIDVMPNGSGNISFAIGMTQQAKALLTKQSANTPQDTSKIFADEFGATEDLKITSWIDGDYEWTKAEKKFASPDEVNNILNRNKLFKHFTLTRSHGLLRDVISLDAEFSPLDDNTSGNDLGVDASTLIQMAFSARLPGKIIETNGLRDNNDPNRIVWNMASKQAVSIKATSGAWNWPIIFALSGFLLIVGVIAVGGVGYGVYALSKKNRVLNKVQPVVSSPIPDVDFEDLGIERLLLQLNVKVLEMGGQIQKKPGAITLAWKDRSNQEKMIEVKAMAGNQLSINGNAYSATKKDSQEGIIAEFKREVKK